MTRLELFSKAECHLCEEAQDMLQQVLAQHAANVEVVDVTRDADLLARYGARVPVLTNADSGEELAWPFGPVDIVQLMGRGA